MQSRTTSPDDPGASGVWRQLRSLLAGGVGVAAGFALAAAIMFSPIFAIPFTELLGRTLFLCGVLLAVFLGVQRVPEGRLPRWLPRWLVTVFAMAVAAPLTTFAIYLIAVGGDVRSLVQSPPRMMGFVLLAGAGLFIGMIVALAAQLREREARAKSLALQLELERSRLERQALDARLALMTAQIEPHFLFNTLANVQALVEAGSPRAAPVLQSLIAYLRAAVPRLHEGEPTLGRELALVRSYLELMVMRMPDRLRWRIAVDPRLESQRFPSMALLTLVENAVCHGIDASEVGGGVEIGARTDAASGLVYLWVADTGVGMAESAVPGMGLTNLRERLTGTFGPRAELRLTENSPRGLRAELVIPASG
jgi:signal transduction histidine kinase